MIILPDLIKKFINNSNAKQRFEICVQCSNFDFISDKCRMCGCVMTLKTFIPLAKCPDNKW